MSFQSIIRRSISTAAPFAAKFAGPPSSAAATTAATLSPRLIRRPISAACRRFSSATSAAFDDDDVYSDEKLRDVLQSEIELIVLPDDHGKKIAVPEDFDFRIKDNPREQTVTLLREYDGETITVEASMPNTITGVEDESGDEDDDEDGDDNERHTHSKVPLLVTVIQKDGNSPHLQFDCTALPAEIRINGLRLKNPKTEDQLAYEGPDFLDLHENLRRAFHRYLEMRGIKASTTNFLHEYMVNKDYKEYRRWLEDVKNFIEA
ncbi:hypothetical protein vseg_002420 [Gypsophila vaccaria]